MVLGTKSQILLLNDGSTQLAFADITRIVAKVNRPRSSTSAGMFIYTATQFTNGVPVEKSYEQIATLANEADIEIPKPEMILTLCFSSARFHSFLREELKPMYYSHHCSSFHPSRYFLHTHYLDSIYNQEEWGEFAETPHQVIRMCEMLGWDWKPLLFIRFECGDKSFFEVPLAGIVKCDHSPALRSMRIHYRDIGEYVTHCIPIYGEPQMINQVLAECGWPEILQKDNQPEKN